MSEHTSHPIEPTGPIGPRHAASGKQSGEEVPSGFSRRELGLFGLAGVVGAYWLDRADPMVQLADLMNPFNDGEESRSDERQLLEPEKYDIDVAWLPETVSRWNSRVIEQSRRFRIDPLIPIFALAIESGGYSRAGSPAGAKGLMQITEIAEMDVLNRGLVEKPDGYDIWDPSTNIEFGVAAFSVLRDQISDLDYDRSLFHPVELMAAGYNGGFEGAAKPFAAGEGQPFDESLVYLRDLFNMYRERNASVGLTYQRWLERGGQTLYDAALAEM
jgi:Transglycosylase SLT domain